MTDITEDNRLPWRRSEDLGAPVSLSVIMKGMLAGFVDCVISWQQRASERHHLRGLDDRLLKDIGITRADVDNEVSKPFWRP